MKVYLSGPLSGCTDEEIYGWRTQVQGALSPLGYEFTNTTLRIYDKLQEPTSDEYIVESDLHEIDLADILLVYVGKHSVGCAIETHYAWERSKIVIMVFHSGYSHVWLRHFSDWSVHNLNDAINLLMFAARQQLDKVGLKKLIQEQL